MSSDKAVAQVFLTALKSLTPKEQSSVFSKILEVRKWREDLMDLAIVRKRRKDKFRSFGEFTSKLASARK